MPDALADSRSSRRIGRYEIVRELGRGGMAVVHLARQPDLDRLVALKELAVFGPQYQEMAHRFLREARFAGSLKHPNIVTVYESIEIDRLLYIAMEYVGPDRCGRSSAASPGPVDRGDARRARRARGGRAAQYRSP